MVELAKSAKCLPVSEPPELENWVHPSGRLILIGDTAHPFPYGATQGVAVCIADAAALGEFFRHLHNDSQIKSFLLAFEEIRKERIQNVLKSEVMNLTGMTLPDGEFQQMRDTSFRQNYDLGLDAFDGEDKAARARWEMDKDVFAYDAEEHAAEWWNDWGLLKERAYASESAQPVLDALGPVHIQVSSQSQDVILRAC
ncbi:hypothetical protein EW026_g3455 [Hermanssonia centrifuga]|uniref:FAD-binding domain-containing protein n=1 Tax=Hermanssonia centrifuga TaxID=98765 RepID=A0A4S4KL30_9APHY|nr:hypothetical protein EW026_g3455 [Hermanssonia centrifuga]